MISKPRPLTLPSGFGVTQLVLHYAAEDLAKEQDQFAGTLVVQLRMDVNAGDAPSRVAATDRRVLEEALPYFKLISDADTASMPSLSIQFRDEDGKTLEQLIIYLRADGHLYTVTGTHRAGPRFETMRPGILELAATMSRGS